MLLCLPAFGQSGKQEQADLLFAKGEYGKALPLYVELSKSDTASAVFLFRTAVCMVKATPHQEKALELLDEVMLKAAAPVQTLFYLGEASRRLYRFEDAISYFETFLEKAKESDELRGAAELNISACENGLLMLGYASKVNAVGKRTVAASAVSTVYDTFSESYVALKPKSMMMAADSSYGKLNDKLVVFPKNDAVANADVIYFSSYGEDASAGLDIFCIRRLEGDSWGEPENLGPMINTPFDEDFPYIANDGVTLYFASKGHYGMGGYDIYKSVYDPSAKQWSVPENLGFPFSTPFDDFLFVPDAANQYACFASGRETYSDSLTVYKVRLELNPEMVSLTDEGEIRSMALFSTKKTSTLAVKTEPIDVPIKALANNEAYLQLISAVKNRGAAVASASNALDGLREKLVVTEDEAQQVSLSKQIVEGEKNLETLTSTLEKLQQALSGAEYEFLTNGKKPAIHGNVRALVEGAKAPSTDRVENLAASTEASWRGGMNRLKEAPMVKMKPPTMKEEDKYRFRSFGKSIVMEEDPLPKGVVYKVRIAIVAKSMSEEQLKNLSPITTEKRGTSKRYYVGVFKSYDEAVNALGIVKKKGFKDAVIDSWVNGKPELIAKARAAEKRSVQIATATRAGKSTVSYRLSVTVAASYTAKNIPSLLSSLSGGKDIVKRTNSNSTVTYSVGIFNRLEDAEKIKERLGEEGIRSVEIVQLN